MYNAIIKFNAECLHDNETTSTFEVTIFHNDEPFTKYTFRTMEGVKNLLRCYLTKKEKIHVNS